MEKMAGCSGENARGLVKKKKKVKINYKFVVRLNFSKMATSMSPHILVLYGDLTLLSWRDRVSVPLLGSRKVL